MAISFNTIIVDMSGDVSDGLIPGSDSVWWISHRIRNKGQLAFATKPLPGNILMRNSKVSYFVL